jgi:signal transduction histidine kinase
MTNPRTSATNEMPLRGAAKSAAGVILVALVVAALIFSNSFAARQVTEDARVLGLSESVLGSNALALKSLSQALLLAEDLQLGVADAATVQAALTESRQTLAVLSDRTDALSASVGSGGAELAAVSRATLEAGGEIVALIEEGRVKQAGDLLAGDALGAFENLRDAASDRQQGAAEGIEATSDFLSRLGSLPAFLVAFLVPGAAILVYRRIAKGQLRVAEVQLDARLEAERQIVVAKDEFVASISHELRTPLTTIYGFSEILLDEGLVDPAYATELLTLINTESAELHRMVEDLLTTARFEAGTIAFQIGPVDLREELELNLTAMERTGLEVETDLAAAKVWADQMRVRQILRNLLTNAHQHGGEVVRVTSEEVGEGVEVVIADNGSGVPADKEVRLFTRYIHEGEDPLTIGSVGLGLAVVQILAEGMGGAVRYERQAGWSRFIVTLPGNNEGTAPPIDISDVAAAPPLSVGYGRQIAASHPLEEEWPGMGAP